MPMNPDQLSGAANPAPDRGHHLLAGFCALAVFVLTAYFARPDCHALLVTLPCLAGLALCRGSGQTRVRGIAFIATLAGSLLALQLGENLLANVAGYVHGPWLRCLDTVIDGREILKTALMRHGRTIYPDFQDYPYLVTLYTPGYFLYGATIMLVVGNPVLAAKLASLTPLLGLCALIVVWLRRETGKTWLALAMAAVFFMLPGIAMSGLMTRPDYLAWFCLYTGVFLVLAPGARSPNRTRLVLAGLAFCLAALCKQQTLPMVAAFLLACLLDRQKRRLVPFLAGVVAVLGLACAAILVLASDGSILRHVLVYPVRLAGNESITNLGNALPRFKLFLRLQYPLLALWGLAVTWDALRKRPHSLDWVLLFYCPIQLRLMMTWGASTNYWWGIQILLCLRVGIFLGQIARGGDMGRALVLVALLALSPAPLPHLLHALRPALPGDDDVRLGQAVAALGPGRILAQAEAAAPLLTSGEADRIDFYDAMETLYFERAGMWRFLDSKMAADIVARRFRAIVTSQTNADPDVLQYIQNYYRISGKFGSYTLYEPFPGPVVPYSAPTDQPVVADACSVQTVQVLDVDLVQSFGAFSFSKKQNSPQGSVVFAVQAPTPITGATVVLYPKIAHFGPGDRLLAEWSLDGRSYVPFLEYRGTPGDMATGLFEPRLEATFLPNASKVSVRFTLQGSAQLWFNAHEPMVFRLEVGQ